MRVGIQLGYQRLGLGHLAVEHNVELVFSESSVIAAAKLMDILQQFLTALETITIEIKEAAVAFHPPAYFFRLINRNANIEAVFGLVGIDSVSILLDRPFNGNTHLLQAGNDIIWTAHGRVSAMLFPNMKG